MSIALKPEQQQFIQQQVALGRFRSEDEALDRALQLLAEAPAEIERGGDILLVPTIAHLKNKLQIDTSQLKWQQAIDSINLNDRTNIEQKKANISQLIVALNEDDDIEEQQQTLEIISSLAGVSI